MSGKFPLEADIKDFIQQHLLKKLDPQFLFHNYDYTLELVADSKKIGKLAALPQEELEVLLITAYFYTSGFVSGIENHTDKSADLATEFLAEKKIDAKIQKQVKQLLTNDIKDQDSLQNLYDILQDAKWAFLGKKKFSRKAMLLRLENERIRGKKLSLREWNKNLLDIQIQTTYRTPWANELFGKRKKKNIVKQKLKLREAKKKTIRSKTGKDFGRGIDTVYRVTLKSHIDLSSIADGKANMIISINTLILSILITVVTAGISLGSNPLKGNISIFIPIIILLCSALLAIVFAVFSAIPKISGTKKEETEKGKTQNMLFFGNFLELDEKGFVNYLKSLKKDQEKLYDDLSRDLYGLGTVLNKKYKLLTISYRIFVSGLALSLLSFLFIYLVYPGYM